MKRTLTLGGLHQSTHLANQAMLPILPDTHAQTMIMDALDKAVSQRKGFAVVGPKGAGKSFALERATEEFDDSERAMEDMDATHERRRIRTIWSPRAERRVEILEVIWREVLGEDMPRRDGTRNKAPDILLAELVDHLLELGICALVFDEAENLTDVGFTTIRDIISVAQQRAQDQFSGGKYRAVGLGVLLIGDERLEPLVKASREAMHRVAGVYRVENLSPAEAAEVYCRFVPGIGIHASVIGEGGWSDFVRNRVVFNQAIPLRFIETHARLYISRMTAEDHDFACVADIPYDAEMFLHTLREVFYTREVVHV